MSDVLLRNVYGDDPTKRHHAVALSQYIRRYWKQNATLVIHCSGCDGEAAKRCTALAMFVLYATISTNCGCCDAESTKSCIALPLDCGSL